MGKTRRPSNLSLNESRKRKYVSYLKSAYTAADMIGRWWKRRGRGNTAAAMKRQKTENRSQQKSGIRIGAVEQNGTGGQISKYIGPKQSGYIPKNVIDSTAPIIYNSNGAGQLLSAVGKQNIVCPLQLCTQTNYNNVSSSGKIYRYYLEKSMAELDLVNIYLSNCRMTIYDIVARKDIGQSSIDDPSLVWAQGDTDEGVTQQYKIPGATPFQTDAFNTYYKVMQVTNVTLGAGEQHTHRVSLEPRKLITGPYGAYSICFKDVSYFCLVVISGQPANDTVTQTSVSLGAGGVNFVYRAEHHWRQLQLVQATILGSSSLATSYANAEQVVNVGGSTITSNAEG